MINPSLMNLYHSTEIRAAGWQAESRDVDGHLTRCHAPFGSDVELAEFVRECLGHGETVTIWPVGSSYWEATPHAERAKVPTSLLKHPEGQG